ncbi:MAG: DUF4783 domain-containing protein [Bacteroidetes bacterium]|nr:DUF4783 domain-containing protein [Bacteroidota bacterium]MBU2584419.1 DUF4783 domain-containing protein [Bacteroidota bacterium]
MKFAITHILICIAILLIGTNYSFGQNVSPRYHKIIPEKSTQPSPAPVFEHIISGIESGNVSGFANYFSKQIYISLNSGERGYYSSNQAFYVLQNYFNMYKPIDFRVSTRLINSLTPYCAGKLIYGFRGIKESVQVYIGLSWTNDNWEISQITFN